MQFVSLPFQFLWLILCWLAEGPEGYLGKRLPPAGLKSWWALVGLALVPPGTHLPNEIPNYFSGSMGIGRHDPVKINMLVVAWIQVFEMVVEGVLSR